MDILKSENSGDSADKTVADLPESGLLKEKEAATYLGISPRLLWGWRTQKKVPYIRFGRGTIRYKRKDLDRFIDSKRVS